jgi:hypothetical protein
VLNSHGNGRHVHLQRRVNGTHLASDAGDDPAEVHGSGSAGARAALWMASANSVTLGMYSDSVRPRSHLIHILEALGSGIRTRLGDTFWGPLPPRIAALADSLAGPIDSPGGSHRDGEAPDFGATLLF